ncbi:hypothetical protein RJ640_002722 [Escallonia rubra]|uniref:Uncharacterized protein n=1 Tax=Escallonia rubra TaxID=112253 RepID=A0AA88S8T7_9ASTE|nr:hypothetical protein RJ640_002722 [Escallonia rubra]
MLCMHPNICYAVELVSLIRVILYPLIGMRARGFFDTYVEPLISSYVIMVLGVTAHADEIVTVYYDDIVDALDFAKDLKYHGKAKYSNPISAYWNAGKRILRHLRGTADLILCYHGEDLRLRGVYIDADWGGDKDERRST